MDNFQKAFELIIGVEAGYVNDPKDPGGETKFGISKRSYPTEDIPNLTLQRAQEIYKRDYWDKLHCEELSTPLDIFVFDAGVNQGATVAAKLLQKVCGVVQDGIIGVGTIVASNKSEAAELFMADRAIRYTQTNNADVYLRGWLKRLFKITLGA